MHEIVTPSAGLVTTYQGPDGRLDTLYVAPRIERSSQLHDEVRDVMLQEKNTETRLERL